MHILKRPRSPPQPTSWHCASYEHREPWVFSDCICFIDKSIRFAKQFATTKIHCTTKETQRERQGKREREKGRFDRATNVIKINYERVSSLRCLLRAIKGKHHLFNAISLLDASQSRRHSCCCCSPHPGSCFPDTVTQALRSEHPCYVCSSSSYFFHLRSAFAFHLQQDNAADYADDK